MWQTLTILGVAIVVYWTVEAVVSATVKRNNKTVKAAE